MKSLRKSSRSERSFKDTKASISIHTQIGDDDEKVHKKLHILDQAGQAEEIATDMIKALRQKRQFTRYYFAERSDRDRARQLGGRAKWPNRNKR